MAINQKSLGCTVKDRITGFVGVATGVVDYITGCSQALVQPLMAKDGTVPESKWIDVQRLEIVPGKPQIVLDNSSTPGFDKPAPKR